MDYGSRYAEKRLKTLELRLLKVYKEAQKDLEAGFDDFLKKHRKKGQEMWRKLKDGEISQADYSKWMRLEVLAGTMWQSKIDDSAAMMTKTNKKALSMINAEKMGVFAENANYEAFTIEKDFHGVISFDIYSTEAVDRLIMDKPELLPPMLRKAKELVPEKKLVEKKDRAWNQGIIANAVTQSIIQGESIQNLAKRLARDTASKDMSSMVRYSRTAMTSAQNGGRIDAMKRAEALGVRVQKQWRSVLDSRTRDSHQYLDGQIRDVDKPFKSLLGDIRFPGDPQAKPGDVWNCRCGMKHIYPDFPSEQAERIAYREYTDKDGVSHRESYRVDSRTTYNVWRNIKRKMEPPAKPKKKITARDITDQYLARKKQEPAEIKYFRGYKAKDGKNGNKAERDTAELIVGKFGGHLKHVPVEKVNGIRRPDYLWNGKLWELKSPESSYGTKSAIHSAEGQIKNNPGGIILNFEDHEIDMDEVIKLADERMTRFHFGSKLIVISKGKVVCVREYKK